jgi:hypothetical protein
VIVTAAAGLALLPTSQGTAELWHAAVYARVQPRLTSWSSAVPVAWLDLLAVAVVIGSLAALVGHWRGAGALGRRAAAVAGWAAGLAVSTAALYLLFMGLWGLNYRRAPLADRLEFAPARVTPASMETLAGTAIDRLNALHAEAHAQGWPAAADLPARLGPAFGAVLLQLGSGWQATPAAPKPTLFGPYFRAASISGLTNPFGLDVMITPDALPFERPSILAHEWGHLAGYAHEAEAGFVGWLTCVHGDVPAQYSGWLDLLPRVLRGLPAEARARVSRHLATGPRADFAAIAKRIERASPTITGAAWIGYDRFLKANRVPEGVTSYDAVARLVVGTEFGDGWKPRLAPRGLTAK